MKTILYATDYSDNSVAALKYAHKISTQVGARLVITHVFDYPTVLGNKALSEPFPNLEKDAFKTHLTKLKAFYNQHLGDDLDEMNVSMEVVENKSVVNGIVSKADEIKAFMIVAGMKGKSALKEFIMGNTTRHLIDKAHCLVMAIPEDAYYNEIKTIVYATDFEVDADIEVIQKVIEVANAFDAKIEVVHISTEKEYAGAAQIDWLKNKLKKTVSYKKMGFKILFSEDVFDSLRIYLGDVNADLVIMLEREKSGFFKNLFHRDLVKKMEIYGKIPMISFNKNNFGMLYFLKFN